MIFALSVILKTTILLASASLMTLALRRTSASTKHTVWAIALLCALVLPFASVTLPEINLAVLPAEPLLAKGGVARGARVVRHTETFSLPADPARSLPV